MNPSLTSCFFWKASPQVLRSSDTAVMSISLNVVSSAVACFASTRARDRPPPRRHAHDFFAAIGGGMFLSRRRLHARRWRHLRCGRRRRRCRRCSLRRGWPGTRRRSGRTLVDFADDFADCRRLALVLHDFRQPSGRRRRHFHRGLLGVEDRDGFVLRNRVALGLQPLADFDRRDRLADRRHFQFDGHSVTARVMSSSCSRLCLTLDPAAGLPDSAAPLRDAVAKLPAG